MEMGKEHFWVEMAKGGLAVVVHTISTPFPRPSSPTRSFLDLHQHYSWYDTRSHIPLSQGDVQLLPALH